MKSRFRNIIVGYVAVWILAIVIISVMVWFGLARFQRNYEEQKILQADQTAEIKENENTGGADRVAPEEITLSYDSDKKQDMTPDEIQGRGLEIIAYSDMNIKVDGGPAVYEVKEKLDNQLLAEYSALTGNVVEQCIYLVSSDSYSRITVENQKGEQITPSGNDYTAGVYQENPTFSKTAVLLLEQYLMHVSKMISLEELQESMRSSSPAYKAMRNSQKSLEWMIAAKEMVFPKEEVRNMLQLDENHMICDVYIDLRKVTENNRTVEESVKYRVLYEQVKGKWYIYSFEIIV